MKELHLEGTHHSQYLFMNGNFSSWAYSGYKGSVHHDPNDVGVRNTPTLRHFIFQSEEVMNEINRVGIKKAVCGDNHLFILLNDGQAFANGWNEYTQLLTRKIAPKSNQRDQLVKVDIDHIEDIYCGANFTYCLARGNDGFKMYSAGWNNESCCAQGLNSAETYKKIGRVYYSDGDKQEKFPPPNETVIDVRCGGSNAAILTHDNISNTYYLSHSGSFEKLPTLKPGVLFRTALPKGLAFCRMSLVGNSVYQIYLHTATSTYDVNLKESYKDCTQINRRYSINRNGKLYHFPSQRQTTPTDVTFKSFTWRNKMMAVADNGSVYADSTDEDLVELDFLPLLSLSDRYKFQANPSQFDVSVCAGEEVGFVIVKKSGEKGMIFKERLLKQTNSDNPFVDCIMNIRD